MSKTAGEQRSPEYYHEDPFLYIYLYNYMVDHVYVNKQLKIGLWWLVLMLEAR